MNTVWYFLPEIHMVDTVRRSLHDLIDLYETELDIVCENPENAAENTRHVAAVIAAARGFEAALAAAGALPIRTVVCAAVAFTGRIAVHEPGLAWAADAFVAAARELETQLAVEPASECEAVVWLLATTAANIRRDIFPGVWDTAAESVAAVDRIETLLAGRAPPVLVAAVGSVLAADMDVDGDVEVAIDNVSNLVCRWAAGAVVAVDGEIADDCIDELYDIIDDLEGADITAEAAAGIRLVALLMVVARRAYAEIDYPSECAAIADALEQRCLRSRLVLPSIVL